MEDDFHFLFDCPQYDNTIEKYLFYILNQGPNQSQHHKTNIECLFYSQNMNVLIAPGKFMKFSLFEQYVTSTFTPIHDHIPPKNSCLGDTYKYLEIHVLQPDGTRFLFCSIILRSIWFLNHVIRVGSQP